MPQKTPDGRKEGYGFVVLTLTVIAFFVICHFGFLREDDWLTHFEASSLSDVFRQTRMFYLTRGGRWFSVASQYLFAGPLGEYKICFDLVNTLVFLALLFVGGCLIQTGTKNGIRPIVVFALSFWFLCPVPRETVFWIAGATTYLWAITLTFLFLAIFLKYKDDSFSLAGKIALFFLSVISANEFISCVSICGAFVVYYIFHIKEFKNNAIPMVLGYAVGSAIVLLAPGNFARAAWEGQSLISKLSDLANHPLLEIFKYKALWLLLITLLFGWVKDKNAVKTWVHDNSIMLLSLFWGVVAFSIVFRPLERALFFPETLSLILCLKFLYDCHRVFGISLVNEIFGSSKSPAGNLFIILLTGTFVLDASLAIAETRKQQEGNQQQLARLAASDGIVALDRMVSGHRMAYVEHFPTWTWEPLADHFGLDSVHVYPYFCQDKFYPEGNDALGESYLEEVHENDDSFGRQIRLITRMKSAEQAQSARPVTIMVQYTRPRKWYKSWLDKIRNYQYDRSFAIERDEPDVSFDGYDYYILWIKRENAKHISHIELSMAF